MKNYLSKLNKDSSSIFSSLNKYFSNSNRNELFSSRINNEMKITSKNSSLKQIHFSKNNKNAINSFRFNKNNKFNISKFNRERLMLMQANKFKLNINPTYPDLNESNSNIQENQTKISPEDTKEKEQSEKDSVKKIGKIIEEPEKFIPDYNLKHNKTIKTYTVLECFEDIQKNIFEKRYSCDPERKTIIQLSAQLNLKKGQIIRGVRKCPGGSTTSPKICVFTSTAFEKIAKEAGADMIGTPEVYDDIIQNQNVQFDLAIASMDVMMQVKNLGRYLGPLNLMPTPKIGTAVLPEMLEETIKKFKSGYKEFRSNKNGKVNFALGRINFNKENLLMNMDDFLRELENNKGSAVKGKRTVKNLVVSVYGLKGSYLIDTKSLMISEESYFGIKYSHLYK
jgi:large subunit ribosomal protein L1